MRRAVETDTRDLARGAGVNYLGYALRLGARAPFLLVAALLYGEVRFGEYVFGLSIVETAAALALFGLKRSLFKFMSESTARQETVYRAVANGVALATVMGAIATGVVIAGASHLAQWFHLPSAAHSLPLLAAAIPLIVTSDILLVAIRFTRQMRYEVMARSIAEPITLSVVAVSAYYLGAREHGLFIGYLASLTVAAAASVFFFARVFPIWTCLRMPLAWGEMRQLVSFSGPTAGYELMTLLGDQVDVYLVTYFFPAGVVGVYGMARQFSTFTKKVRQGFDRILPPVLSDAIAAGDLGRVGAQLALVSRWILSVQVLLVLVFAFFGNEVLGLLGGKFAGGAVALTLLLIGDAVNGSLGVSELPIVYLRPKANLLLGAGRLLLSLGTGIWLIGALGMEGAALSVVVTYCAINLARIVVNWGLFGIVTVRRSIGKPPLAAIPAAASAFLVLHLTAGVPVAGMVLGVPVLIGGYLTALYRLGLEPEERLQLRKLLGRGSAPASPG